MSETPKRPFVRMTSARYKALVEICDADPKLEGKDYIVGVGRAWFLKGTKDFYAGASREACRFSSAAAATEVLDRIGRNPKTAGQLDLAAGILVVLS